METGSGGLQNALIYHDGNIASDELLPENLTTISMSILIFYLHF